MDNKKLIEIVASRLEKNREEISALSDSLCAVMTEALKNGDTIAIPSVGNFETKLRAERIATHPATGKRLLIPPKLSVVFKPSLILKQKLRSDSKNSDNSF